VEVELLVSFETLGSAVVLRGDIVSGSGLYEGLVGHGFASITSLGRATMDESEFSVLS
jgi:hypothetical protein